MNRTQRIETLFESALPLAPPERAVFLELECGGDEALRAEVESLLAAHRQARFFFAAPAANEAAALLDSSPPGLANQRIGQYQLVSEIGRGGMGMVFLAERADGDFRQRVAIKLIKRGMDTDEVLRRFRHERQILAALNHPHIARLLDGGTTADGLPYFVMEYVEGQPVDDYCNAHRLSINDRLGLFLKVCDAVGYAHRNLVIHRDLKPGNILVTGDGAPKLLDFGIAKLLNPEISVSAIEETATGLRPMTPEYASPEQVRGASVTTATDVYSLGVVLYELLTGQRPYQLASHTPQEIMRVVCESDPLKPSTAAAQRLPGEAALLSPSVLRGDLDNIVMMALRKEPERRYTSVEQLGEDLRRHLTGLPISARDNTRGYRAAKFVKRHKASVLAASLLLLSLVAGLAATVWQARVARAERARAEQRFNDVRKLANTFLFEFHDGIEKLPGATPMRELLVKRALEYLDSLAREAGDEAGLQNELATAYERVGNIQSSFGWANQGDTAGALASYRKALAIRESLAGVNPPPAQAQLALAAALGKVGQTLIHTHDFQGAADSFRRAQALLEPLLAREPDARRQFRNILTLLGQALSEQNQAEQAMNTLRRALRLAEEELAQNPADNQARRGLAATLYEMGYLLLGTKDNAQAVALYRRSLAICEQLAKAAPHDPQARRDLALAYDQLGSALYEAGDLAGELENYRASLRLREELAAAEPASAQARNDLATGYYNLGYALAQNGETDAGVASYQKAVALMEAISAANPANARLRAKLAMFYVYFGKLWELPARQARPSRAVQRHRWEAARVWYQRALTLTNEMRAQNLSTGSAVSTPAQLTGHINRCDAALAKLK